MIPQVMIPTGYDAKVKEKYKVNRLLLNFPWYKCFFFFVTPVSCNIYIFISRIYPGLVWVMCLLYPSFFNLAAAYAMYMKERCCGIKKCSLSFCLASVQLNWILSHFHYLFTLSAISQFTWIHPVLTLQKFFFLEVTT